ncbi:MAG: Xaa-Pro peptidase family protein [Paracoccaceae bacterium]|nr:Xaa-Pro peptidase family protein [Paracoccaceae bacterium]
MAHLDRQRASRLMSQAGIDSLILFSPESFSYATGTAPGVAAMWRQTGAVAVLVPADTDISEAAIVSDLFAKSFLSTSHIKDVRESPIWVETTNIDHLDPNQTPESLIWSAWQGAGRSKGFERPTKFDPLICFRHLADALSERGLNKGAIGFEASAVSMLDFPDLKGEFGNLNLVDASEVVAKLKMVKSESEIASLRKAVDIAETGIHAVHHAIALGVTRDQLARAWKAGIKSHSEQAALSGSWEYISVGPNPWGGNATAQSGDLIKVDVGCLVDGYTSDSGRTYVLGQPGYLKTRLHDALMQGFVAGSALLRPGVALAQVHRVTLEAIRAAGFPGYTRGHFGHGLGAGLGSEEWPFISEDATIVFEPGMVMAFECPWYIDGLGGMIIENQVLITETGHEMMNTLPLDLMKIAM